jgi:uncharacterized protein YndB with AHSA1/START domain
LLACAEWSRTFRTPRAPQTRRTVTHPEDTIVSATEFHYLMAIKATPERVWEGLTDSALLRRYHGAWGPESDWKQGAVVRWSMSSEREFRDYGQAVLVSEPPRRLVYTWHNYEPEMREMFGWTEEQLTEKRKEKVSKVSFEIEPLGEGSQLTVLHDDFSPGSEMLAGISEGWPMLLSSMKTLLETGEPMDLG